MKKNKFYKTNINMFTSKFTFISGVTRSGKSFLCPIVSSLKKAEMFFMSSIAENIAYVDSLGGFDKVHSSYLFKLILNETVYNLNIGRQINPRKSDYTSFYKFKNPNEYLKRLRGPEGNSINKKIKFEDHIYPMMFHDALINPKLLLSNLKNSRIVFIRRHPAELIHEWIKKKYYGSFYKNPRNVTLSYRYKKTFIPYWGLKYANKIIKTDNLIDKTIYLLFSLIDKQIKNFNGLNKSQKKKIMFINFDEMITSTNRTVVNLCKFLKTTESKYTKKIIIKENGNRKINFSEREKYRSIILRDAGDETVKLYLKLERAYLKN